MRLGSLEDNPYAPPVPVATAADLSPRQAANFYELSFATALYYGLIASVAIACCVLLYQIPAHWFGWHSRPLEFSWRFVAESASFSSAGLFTALAFAVPWGSKDQGRCLSLAVLFGVVGLLLFIPGVFLARDRGYDSSFLLLLPASQLVTLIAMGRIRRVPIHVGRLLIGTVAGFGGWFLLTMAAIEFIVRHQSHPYDDYTGYTLLTVFWSWTVAAQVPFLLRRPRGRDE